jgi:DNA-binding MarR family transcriptional regulator
MNKLEKFTPCGEITPITAKLLLILLREITNDHDTVVIPQRKIAAALGITRGTVSRNLRRLEQAGAISIHEVYNAYGGRMPNKITLRRDSENGRT